MQTFLNDASSASAIAALCRRNSCPASCETFAKYSCEDETTAVKVKYRAFPTNQLRSGVRAAALRLGRVSVSAGDDDDAAAAERESAEEQVEAQQGRLRLGPPLQRLRGECHEREKSIIYMFICLWFV